MNIWSLFVNIWLVCSREFKVIFLFFFVFWDIWDINFLDFVACTHLYCMYLIKVF